MHRRSGEPDPVRRRTGADHRSDDRSSEGFSRHSRTREGYTKSFSRSSFERSGRRDGSIDGARRSKDRDGEQEQARVLTLVRPKLNSGSSGRPAPLRVVAGGDSSSSRSASPALIKAAEPHTPAGANRQSTLALPAFFHQNGLPNGVIAPKADIPTLETSTPTAAASTRSSQKYEDQNLPNGNSTQHELVQEPIQVAAEPLVTEAPEPETGEAVDVADAQPESEPSEQGPTPQPEPLLFFSTRPQPSLLNAQQNYMAERPYPAPAPVADPELDEAPHAMPPVERGERQFVPVHEAPSQQQMQQPPRPVQAHQQPPAQVLHLHQQMHAHHIPSPHPGQTPLAHHEHIMPQQPMSPQHDPHAAHMLQQPQQLPQQVLHHAHQHQQTRMHGNGLPVMHQAPPQGQYSGGYAPAMYYQRQAAPEGSSPLVTRYSPHMNGNHHMGNPSLPQNGPQQPHPMMMPQVAFSGPGSPYMQAYMVPGPHGMPQMMQMRPPSVGTSTPPHMTHSPMGAHQANSPPAYPSYTSTPSQSHPMHALSSQSMHPHAQSASLRRPEPVQHQQHISHTLPYHHQQHQQQPQPHLQQQQGPQQPLQQSPQHLGHPLHHQPHHQQAAMQQQQQQIPPHLPRGGASGMPGAPQPHAHPGPLPSLMSKAPSASLSIQSSGVLSSAPSLKHAGPTQLRASAPSFVPGGLRLGTTSSSSGLPAAASSSAQAPPLQPSTPTPGQTHPQQRLMQPSAGDPAEPALPDFSLGRPQSEEPGLSQVKL